MTLLLRDPQVSISLTLVIRLDRTTRMGWVFYQASQASYYFARSLLGQSIKGTKSGFHFSHTLTILSILPDHLVEHVSGLGQLGAVEHQVDVVVLVETTTNIGNALDGTLNISQEDVEEFPSEEEAIADAGALVPDGDGLLKWLKKRGLRSIKL